MKNKAMSICIGAIAAFALLLAEANVAFGLAPGDEINIQFNETSPPPPDTANGTFTLGAAVSGHPGVFHIASFAVTCADCGAGILFNPTSLTFDSNTSILSGTAAGTYVATGGGVFTDTLKLPTTGATFTLIITKVSNGAKQTFTGTYTIAAVPTVSLYDDFTAPLIDPTRWYGAEASGMVTEAVRLIQGGSLRLFSRSYGATDSDTGATFSALRLAFSNPNPIHAIRAKVQVTNFQSVGCPGNTTPTFPAAEIAGFFFNTGTPTPGDATGDVHVELDVLRLSNSTNPPGVLEVVGAVVLCQDAPCLTATHLPGSPVNVGKTHVGVPVRLFLAWDQPNKRFLFQSGNSAIVAVPYTVSDSSPPAVAFKRLDSRANVANCTTTPRPHAMLDVLFDHVEVGTQ